MKKFYTFFAAVVLILLFNGSARAVSTTTPILSEGEYRIGTGDIETTFSIDPAIIRGSVGDNETFRAKLGLNYFFDEIWAPGLELDLDAGNGTTFKFLPNVKAYIPTESRFCPYIQAAFGYMHTLGNDFMAFTFGPGLNYMLSNSVAIGVQVRYDGGIGSKNIHVVQVPIQFAIYFKY